MASESSSKRDFSAEENELRTIANARLLELLKDPKAEVPAGQLMAFVSKVGFRVEPEKGPERPQIATQNIFVALKGLPEERQLELLNGIQKQVDTARKELPRGGG